MLGSHEVRYRGELVGHYASESAARDYVAAQEHDDKAEAFTGEPRRQFGLFARGNLVDTFHTAEGAHAAVERLATRRCPVDAWGVVDLLGDIARQLAKLFGRK